MKNKKDENSEIVHDLSFAERLAMFGVLPKEFDMTTYQLKNSILDKIQITEVEFTDNKMSFNEKGQTVMPLDASRITKKIPFTKLENEIVVTELRKLNTARQLNDHTAPLFTKFCK